MLHRLLSQHLAISESRPIFRGNLPINVPCLAKVAVVAARTKFGYGSIPATLPLRLRVRLSIVFGSSEAKHYNSARLLQRLPPLVGLVRQLACATSSATAVVRNLLINFPQHMAQIAF